MYFNLSLLGDTRYERRIDMGMVKLDKFMKDLKKDIEIKK